jgi:hypothetical protein
MKLITKKRHWNEVANFGTVVAAIVNLRWRKKDDTFLILEDEPRGFAQVGCWRPGQYIVEWRGNGDLLNLEQGLFRARKDLILGSLLHKGNMKNGQFPLYSADLMKLEDAVDVLLAFWLRKPRPKQFLWQPFSKMLEESNRLNHPYQVN